MADHAGSARTVGFRDLLPIQVGEVVGNGPAFEIFMRSKEAGNRLVEIQNRAAFIEYQDTVFNGIEECFQETSLPGQTLDDRLDTFGIQPADAAEDFIEKTGFSGHRRSNNNRTLIRHG